MSGEDQNVPDTVFIIKDNMPGHEIQSIGVALWIADLSGSKVINIDIPKFTLFRRLIDLKILARMLKRRNMERCRWWLARTLGNNALKSLFEKTLKTDSKGKNILFLSAGSSGAPFSLALAGIMGAKCACIMTPSVLGTEPFDFAIVPEHDFPKPASNIIVTLGAPNMIRPELIEKEASMLASRYPSKAEEKWGILIGGDDTNYTIPRKWLEISLIPLLRVATENGADVFITTSRRTLRETEESISEIARDFPKVRMLVLGSKDPWNPVPGILGLCNRIFCTEDSVSMISEAATAGHEVNVMRVLHRKGLKRVLQKITEKVADKGLIDKNLYWGALRFDFMMDSFCRRGLAVRADAFPEKSLAMEQEQKNAETSYFNEARRASEWIIKEWGT